MRPDTSSSSFLTFFPPLFPLLCFCDPFNICHLESFTCTFNICSICVARKMCKCTSYWLMQPLRFRSDLWQILSDRRRLCGFVRMLLHACMAAHKDNNLLKHLCLRRLLMISHQACKVTHTCRRLDSLARYRYSSKSLLNFKCSRGFSHKKHEKVSRLTVKAW